jgi:hypothetical protein
VITERERQRIDRIRYKLIRRQPVDRADAQWVLDVAKREGTSIFPETEANARKLGFDTSGVKIDARRTGA